MTDALMSRFRGLAPERAIRRPTPLVSGAAFVLSGVAGLAAWMMFWLPVDQAPYLLSLATPLVLLADGFALAGAVILAFGIRGDRDAVGRSRVGRVALLVVCSYWVLRWVARLTPAEGGLLPLFFALWAWGAVAVVAAIVAGAVIARAGVIVGPARWAPLGTLLAHLVPVAASTEPVTQLYAPTMDQGILVAVSGITSLLPPVAWLVLGAAFVHQGLGHVSGSRYSVPVMSDHEKTQDQPIMDGATEATEQEKQAGREEQREMDAQVDDKN